MKYHVTLVNEVTGAIERLRYYRKKQWPQFFWWVFLETPDSRLEDNPGKDIYIGSIQRTGERHLCRYNGFRKKITAIHQLLIDYKQYKCGYGTFKTRNHNGNEVKVLSRTERRKCDHHWERTWNIPSWRYICIKCGGCGR